MHRSPRRWFLEGWARYAAHSAMSDLGAEWNPTMEWPISVLRTDTFDFGLEGSDVGEKISLLLAANHITDHQAEQFATALELDMEDMV
jgi:hypothetical protein